MKKRPGKHPDQATDIILNDKEMEDLVKQLVQKAHNSGACVTHLNRAISSVWQEQFHIEFEPKKLTEKEKAFAKKTEKFLSHYENYFVEHNGIYLKRYISFNKEYFYQLLCSMYGIFENEDNITKELIVKFAKEHGFKHSNFYYFRSDMNFLNDFISCHLHFYQDNTIPTYSKDWVGSDYSISSMDDYYNFTKQYVISSTRTCQTAIMAIWLIEKYF